MNKKISILLPFYNEENSIKVFLLELLDELNKIKNYSFEIVLLDNNSSDNSYQSIRDLIYKNKYITYKKQMRNFGYQANILAGYLSCNGDAAIQIDSDGEDDPKLISSFLKKWEQGYDVVYGIRVSRKESFIIHLQRKIFYRFINFLSDVNLPNDSGDFRLVDRKIINLLKGFNESNLYLRGIISFIGGKQIGVPYERRKRISGTSKFNWLRYVDFATHAIISFSNRPLYIIAIIGFLTMLLSGSAAFYYLFLYFTGNVYIEGFTTLVLIIIFFNIIILFSMGIISLYLSQILNTVRNRPKYILEDNNED